MNNRKTAPYVELEDGLKIVLIFSYKNKIIKEYDSLVVATGAGYENRRIKGDENKENIIFFRSVQDHKKLKKQIDKIKILVLLITDFKNLDYNRCECLVFRISRYCKDVISAYLSEHN